MKTFEYKSIRKRTTTEINQEITIAGSKGWEIVSVTYKKETDTYTAFLKKITVKQQCVA